MSFIVRVVGETVVCFRSLLPGQRREKEGAAVRNVAKENANTPTSVLRRRHGHTISAARRAGHSLLNTTFSSPRSLPRDDLLHTARRD